MVTGLRVGFFCLHTKNEDELSRYSEKKLCVLWDMLFECEHVVNASCSSNVLIPCCLNHNIFHKVVILIILYLIREDIQIIGNWQNILIKMKACECSHHKLKVQQYDWFFWSEFLVGAYQALGNVRFQSSDALVRNMLKNTWHELICRRNRNLMV